MTREQTPAEILLRMSLVEGFTARHLAWLMAHRDRAPSSTDDAAPPGCSLLQKGIEAATPRAAGGQPQSGRRRLCGWGGVAGGDGWGVTRGGACGRGKAHCRPWLRRGCPLPPRGRAAEGQHSREGGDRLRVPPRDKAAAPQVPGGKPAHARNGEGGGGGGGAGQRRRHHHGAGR